MEGAEELGGSAGYSKVVTSANSSILTRIPTTRIPPGYLDLFIVQGKTMTGKGQCGWI